MRYWLYSNGNMSGPFEAEELFVNPEFSPESMVCEASRSGANPQDWQIASSVPELSRFSVVTDIQPKGLFGETGETVNYDSIFSHPNILDTIDDAVSEFGLFEEKDSSLEELDSFDLKVTQIKEQLETAVWEKNLLLEKIKIREKRESEYKEKIKELEDRVDELIQASLRRAREISGVKEEEIKAPSREIRPETSVPKDIEHTPAPSSQAPEQSSSQIEPAIVQERKEEKKKEPVEEKPRSFKKISAYSDNFKMGNERLIDVGFSEKDDMETFDLKSFGSQKIEANPYISQTGKQEEEPSVIEISPSLKQEPVFKSTAPSLDPAQIEPVKFPEPSPEPVFPDVAAAPALQPAVAPEFKFEPLPQKNPEPQIQPKASSGKVEVTASAFSNMSEIKIEMPEPAAAQVNRAPSAPAQPQMPKSEEKKESASLAPAKTLTPQPAPDVTQRIEVKQAKQTVVAAAKQTAYSPKKNRVKLYISLAISVLIIVGGLAFLVNFRKSAKQSNLMASSSSLQTSRSREQEKTEVQTAVDTAVQVQQPTYQPDAQPTSENKESDSKVSTEAPSTSGQGVKNAIDAVKNFNLSDGRGTVSNWFSNSFGSSGQSREEWTATLLQGKIFVVQYRLIRQKQEPLVYQFEVNSETGQILRGINNNAIDLLESGTEKIKKESVKATQKTQKKPITRPKPRPRTDQPPPLPEREESQYQEPTGFENSDMISKAPVKITAPETDEELF
ncbi:MAG: hypothetical protein Fur0012_13500 [Elusimicrobiota bacterium]